MSGKKKKKARESSLGELIDALDDSAAAAPPPPPAIDEEVLVAPPKKRVRKKKASTEPEPEPEPGPETDVAAEALPEPESSPPSEPASGRSPVFDVETTVNLSGDMLPLPGRDDLEEPTLTTAGEELDDLEDVMQERQALRGALEALVFASDTPIKTADLAKLASASLKQVTELLDELRQHYRTRGIRLDEVAGGWVFRTSPQFAPFVRDLTKQRPVRLSRAQVETMAIIAYRQPITRPEIDDVRGVDSGPVLKVLLERDLIRILGKRDEPGRPLLYGTTTAFLEFFGLKSLKDLPTLREFTELTDESREAYEAEMGEPPTDAPFGGEGDGGEDDDDGEEEDLEGAGTSNAPLDFDAGDLLGEEAPSPSDDSDDDDDDSDDEDA